MEPQTKTFETRLRQQAALSLDVTERVLLGNAEVPENQRKTALALISGQLKQQQVANGRITQIISLTRLGIRDAHVREQVALAALREILPEEPVLPEPATNYLPRGAGGR